MTLALLVTGRSTGTFGTFEVADGNVSKARKLVLQFFNASTALVPMDARSAFTTAEEHAAFDATLMGLSTVGVGIQYVESIGKFMDPKARFTEWLKGDLTPASVGLDLTPEELAVPTAYESAKAKFLAMFTAAIPPREWDQRPVTESSKLKVKTRGESKTAVANGSYEITYKRARTLWESKLNRAWSDRSATDTSSMAITTSNVEYSYDTKRVSIYADRIEIGCQTIQRNVIEELALREGWNTSV